MPTAPRRSRSLVALALVVNLLAASAPTAALGVQRAIDDAVADRRGAPLSAPADAADRAAETRAAEALSTVAPAAATRARVAPVPADWTSRPAVPAPPPEPTTVRRTAATATTVSAPGLRGRNHVWIPALGINRSVAGYSCSSGYYPGNRVYRWGCAGANNVYLFGHAHSVFKPLHDAYVRGRLRKGMKVYYAGSNGRVATYAVSWWRVTTPEKGAWAYAGQSRPSMTLQTCVGSRSQYRLVVRLAKVS